MAAERRTLPFMASTVQHFPKGTRVNVYLAPEVRRNLPFFAVAALGQDEEGIVIEGDGPEVVVKLLRGPSLRVPDYCVTAYA